MKPTSIKIIETLQKAGYVAYWAGGCVRDMLLGINPKDYDIVTSAKPEEIEALLSKTIPIGKEFGVILAIEDGHHFEIATFRSDSGYSDGRRPDAVIFSNPEEDAKRRDFTINALFYDPLKDEILDFVGGQEDLKNKLIRFIGEPKARITEDNLRILRAVRFKNSYGMQYHPETYKAIKENFKLVDGVSKERIRDELNKMITGANNTNAFEELYELDILSLIMPEFCNLKGLAQPLQYHQEGDVWTHSLAVLSALTDEAAGPDPLPETPPSLELRWACLFHDIGKYETFSIDDERIRYDGHAQIGAETGAKILKRLNFSTKSIKKVKWLITYHMMIIALMEMPNGRRRHWFMHENFEELLELFRADCMGTTPTDLTVYHQLKKLYLHEIAELKLMPKQLIDGERLIEILKISPGPKVGEILDTIRELQLEGDLKTSEDAEKYILEHFLRS